MKQMISKSHRILATTALVAASLSGCGDSHFLHFQNTRTPLTATSTHNVREIRGAEAVDMLWVIDNSGSMATHQQKVIDNTKIFMENFTKSSLKWKMGLVSTDVADQPYIGFTNTGSFDWQSPDPVGTFQAAVGRLGTNGSPTEQPLAGILHAFANFHDFSRPGVPMAVMVVTDAAEQSGFDFKNFFLPTFKAAIGDKDKYFVYEVLNASDFGCTGEDGQPWDYHPSPHEDFVLSAYIGKVFPLCKSDFGILLAQISKEIVQNITHSAIYLDARPKPATITVTYKGVQLKPGEAKNGGVWTYDFGMNAIVFNSLDFSTNATDSVKIDFEVDDGFPPTKGAVKTATP